jgi:hypothetical protein
LLDLQPKVDHKVVLPRLEIFGARPGGGIMLATDFVIAIERVANPKSDRVKITMSGKFLPYKYYGASGNVPEYGFKEG